MRLGAKTLFVISLAVLALAIGATAAAFGASRADISFGSDGVSEIPPPREAQGRAVGIDDLVTAKDGKMIAAVGGIGTSAFFGVARFTEDGLLDPTFARTGFSDQLRVRRHGPAGGPSLLEAEGLVVQRDGRIVLAGYRVNSVGGTAPLLARFRFDGSVDSSFGRRGLVAPRPASEATDPLHPYEGGGLLHDVAIQPGGRIVAVGSQNEDRGGRPAGMVVAYRPDGRIDRNFGHRGRVIFPTRNRFNATALTTVEVLPDKTILIAGYLRGRLVLLRLRPDGRLDSRFGGGDGKVTLKAQRFYFYGLEPALLAVQRNGRILLGSEPAWHREHPHTPLVLARFHSNGKPDRSFGTHGIADAKPFTARRFYSGPTDVAVQGNGRIVVVGYLERVDRRRRVFSVFTVLRYLPSGRLDRSFGNGGIETLDRPGTSQAGAATVQASGLVVAGGGGEGRAAVPAAPALLLTRFLPAETPR